MSKTPLEKVEKALLALVHDEKRSRGDRLDDLGSLDEAIFGLKMELETEEDFDDEDEDEDDG